MRKHRNVVKCSERGKGRKRGTYREGRTGRLSLQEVAIGLYEIRVS
jgi:hypothetical protein